MDLNQKAHVRYGYDAAKFCLVFPISHLRTPSSPQLFLMHICLFPEGKIITYLSFETLIIGLSFGAELEVRKKQLHISENF